MPAGGTLYELAALQAALCRSRGSNYTVSEEVARLLAEDSETVEMHEMDKCFGITRPSSVPFVHVCSTITGAQKLPWFKFDFRQQNGPVLIQNVTEIHVGSHISVDDSGYGVRFRTHAIYIGELELSDGDAIQQVPSVVHMQRSASDERSATLRFSSLAAFQGGKDLYVHGASDSAKLRAIRSVNGRACFYDFFAANSEHWASWCVKQQMVSAEAENAKRKMHFFIGNAMAAGRYAVMGVVIAAVAALCAGADPKRLRRI